MHTGMQRTAPTAHRHPRSRATVTNIHVRSRCRRLLGVCVRAETGRLFSNATVFSGPHCHTGRCQLRLPVLYRCGLLTD